MATKHWVKILSLLDSPIIVFRDVLSLLNSYGSPSEGAAKKFAILNHSENATYTKSEKQDTRHLHYMYNKKARAMLV